MSIIITKGAGSIQRLVFSKYYNAQKQKSIFTLWPNCAKNMHYLNNTYDNDKIMKKQ